MDQSNEQLDGIVTFKQIQLMKTFKCICNYKKS